METLISKKERAEYNIQRQKTCEKLGISVNRYNAYRRKGEALHRIFESNCNGDYQTTADYDIAILPLRQDLEGMARQNELYLYIQSDPRGATIYLDKKIIRKEKPDYILILAWHYSDYIIKNWRAKGLKSKFIIPLPNFTIV